MNSYYFITLFLILIAVATSFTVKKKENFQMAIQAPVFHQREAPVKQTNLNDTLQAYTYPSDTLLSPSPGEIASFNSLPYRDPSLEKATYQRILNVQTTLQGFLNNEAKSLSELSDPSIVLPLTTAHGDLTQLRNEVMVLKKNPGIDSSLTQADVDGINANLDYLQRKWRLSIYNDINSIEEGFAIEGFQTSDRASLNELNNLIMKINTTTTMLSSSGTNDPVFTARIQALNALKVKIQAIISDVESGSRPESEIPITHDAYVNFLKTVNNTDSPIKDLTKDTGLPSTLSDIFPVYSSGDVSGANLAKYMFQQYADQLLKGVSWDVNFRYTSENEMNVANSFVNSLSDLTKTINSYVPTKTSSQPVMNDNRGEFASIITNLQQKSQGAPSNSTPSLYSTPSLSSTKPIKFDWHQRSNFICDSIKKRGLNPDDFGCIKPEQYVSENFSWRGYAKMICGRLGASYDTGLPEMCGCPPNSWKGWRS